MIFFESGELQFSRSRPNRILLISLVRSYEYINAFLISIIIFLSTFQALKPEILILFLGIYWIYVLLKARLPRRKHLKARYLSTRTQFFRSLALVVGVTLFLSYVYLGTNYLEINQSGDVLWLLYLLAIFVSSQHGHTTQLFFVLVLSSIFLAVIQFAALGGVTLSDGLGILSKLIFLSLLSLMLHILIKLISDSLATNILVQSIAENIRAKASLLKSKKILMQELVNEVSASFGYAHVNFFEEVSPGKIMCTAAASEDGKKLIKHKYVLPQDEKSIIKHLYYEMNDDEQAYLSLNVHRDGYYLQPSEIFMNTKTELVVKILAGSKRVGVLDIQVDHYNAMFDHDKSTFIALAKLIGHELETMSLLGLTKQERDFIDLIASKFLSIQDLKDIMVEIALMSNKSFHADVCILYVRDTATNELVLEQCTGEKIVDKVSLVNVAEEITPFVNDFSEQTNPSVWFTSLDELAKSPLYSYLGKDTSTRLTHVFQNEKISAAAMVSIFVEEDSIGALVLGFHDYQNLPVDMAFSDLVDFIQSTFARLTAKAIERAQINQKYLQLEKERMRLLLHDNLISHLHLADQMMIESTRSDLGDDFYKYVIMAQEQIDFAMRTASFLGQSTKFNINSTLSENVEQAVRILSAFNVKTIVDYDTSLEIPLPVSYEAGSILFEAVVNAVRHSSLKEFKFSCRVDGKNLALLIEDDGIGGSKIDDIQERDFSIRNRVKSLNGDLKISVNNKGGITIKIKLPLL